MHRLIPDKSVSQMFKLKSLTTLKRQHDGRAPKKERETARERESERLKSEAGAVEAQWEHSTRANQMARQEGGEEGTGKSSTATWNKKKQTRRKNKQIHKMHLLRGTDTI